MIMYTRNNWLPEVFNDFLNTEHMPRTNATAPAILVRSCLVSQDLLTI